VAIVCTSVFSDTDDVDRTAYVMQTWTPEADTWYLISAAWKSQGRPVPTVTSGNGLAVTAIDDQKAPGNQQEGAMWRAIAASPTSGEITLTGDATNYAYMTWSVEKVAGSVAGNPVVQSATGSANSDTPLATLAAFSSADNATFAFAAGRDTQTATPGTGFAELVDQAGSTGSHHIEWRDDNDITADFTLSASGDWLCIAVELEAAAAGPQTLTRTPQEEFTFVDSQARDFYGDRLLSDSFTFTQALVRGKETDRTLAESITFSDQIAESVDLDRILQESNVLSDSLLRDIAIDRIVQDVFTFLENQDYTVTVAGAPIEAALQDTFAFVQQLARDVDVDRLIAETFSFIEEMAISSTGALVSVKEHWRLLAHHKWAFRRRLLRRWMKRGSYPPQ
jgi:hypothetical protein